MTTSNKDLVNLCKQFGTRRSMSGYQYRAAPSCSHPDPRRPWTYEDHVVLFLSLADEIQGYTGGAAWIFNEQNVLPNGEWTIPYNYDHIPDEWESGIERRHSDGTIETYTKATAVRDDRWRWHVGIGDDYITLSIGSGSVTPLPEVIKITASMLKDYYE